jgi:phosphoadenosine phosphosulfate reductase
MTQTLALIQRELDRPGTPCVTSSFQAECVVLVHMLRQYRPDIAVLFLDTVHHFEETCRYRDEIAAAWGLNLVTLRAVEPAPGLWRESTQACCGRHKVEPLFAALRGYDTWFTGLRRDQSASRAGLQEVEPFSVGEAVTLRKVSPLARWTTADVREYANAHAIPLMTMYERGYTSIGCEPCTSLPLDPGNERSGRWGGQKLECGIHLPPGGR